MLKSQLHQDITLIGNVCGLVFCTRGVGKKRVSEALDTRDSFHLWTEKPPLCILELVGGIRRHQPIR